MHNEWGKKQILLRHFFMVTGMAIVGVIDNFMKFIAVEISLWQFHFVRSLIAVPVILIFGLLLGWDLKPKRLWPVLARNIFLSGAMFIYFGCLDFFPIVVVAAGLFTAPVLVMFIDAIWSRCAIGPIRLLTASIGFIMKAYLIGKVTYISIFEYVMIIYAATTAWVVFGDKISPLGFLGTGLIIATGIVILTRSKAA